MNKPSNSSPRVKHISDEIWRIFDHFRGSISIEDRHVLLFLLSGYKDGVLDGLQHEYVDLNNDLIRNYKGSGNYYDVSDVYIPIIQYVPRQILSEIILLFGRINRHELNEFYPEVFDSLLYKLSNAQGRNSGEFIQPFEISRLIMNLADLDDNATVYNPFSGVASFATFMHPSQRYIGQELNQRIWALGKLRLMAFNLNHFEYLREDSIENWISFGEFDLIVSNPPFGMRLPRHYAHGAPSVEMFLIENA